MDFFSYNLIQAIGWTLIHSIWQSLIVALLVFTLMIIFQSRKSTIRYAITVGGLVTVFSVSAFTFQMLLKSADDNHKIYAGELLKTDISSPGVAQSNIEPFGSTFFRKIDMYFSGHMPLFVSVWFLGVLILILKLMTAVIFTQQLKVRSRLSVNGGWQNRLKKLAKKVHISKAVTLCESTLIKVPSVIGFLKPIILMPISATSHLTVEQVEMILMHELVHIKRYDYLINFLQSILDILFFFNPAYRWISKHTRFERELVCDDYVVEVSKDALAYAKTLTLMEEIKMNYNVDTAVAVTGNKNSLTYRVKRLFAKEAMFSFNSKSFVIPLILTFLIMSVLLVESYAYMGKDFNADLAKKLNKLNFDTVTVQYTENGFLSEKEVIVKFLKDEIISVTVDGELIPETEFENYTYVITDWEMAKENLTQVNGQLEKQKSELAQLEKEMAVTLDEMKENIETKESDLSQEQKSELKRVTEELESERKELKEYLEHSTGELNEIKEKELKELDEKLESVRKELKENLEIKKWELDEKQERDLIRLKEELEKTRNKMMESLEIQKSKLNKLKEGMEKIKTELKADGLFNSYGSCEMRFENNVLYINNVKQNKEVHDKYKKIMENYLNIKNGNIYTFNL